MSEPSDRTHVVVLGAGLAGLSVARAVLKSRPCGVTVLEKEGQPGGMAISLRVGGVTTDLGPHRIYSMIGEMRRWFREFLGERMYLVRRVSRMYTHGRYLRYPPSPLELLRALGPAALARFGGGYAMARLRALVGGIDTNSFGGVMESAFGRSLCQTLVFPYIEKVWKTPPYGISADMARARVTMGGMGAMVRRLFSRREEPGSESSLRTFHYVRGGIGTLARGLANEIMSLGGEILCKAQVRGLAVEKGRIASVWFRTENGEDRCLPADFVFSTIPVRDLVESLRGDNDGWRPSDETVRAARGLDSLNVVLVFVLARRRNLSADHWLYFPEAVPRFNRAYESKNFDVTLAPIEQTLLCLEGTALPGSPEWRRPDSEIAREFLDDIIATGLLRREDVVETFVHRLENGYPLYRVDYLSRLKRILADLRAVGNLITLGRQGLFLHNNMDHSIYMGLRAAQCWIEKDNPVASWYDGADEFRNVRIVD